MALRRPLVIDGSGRRSELPTGDQLPIDSLQLPPGYIDGLKMVWVSGTALTVTSGAAYIEGSGKVLRATADIAKTGLSLSASTWYHVYLYSNAGTPDIEIVTTAPAASYNGTARSKTGDSSRRYLGSVLIDASGNVFPFAHSDRTVMYDVNAAGTAPFRVLTNGAATTATSVSVAGCAPLTAWQVVAKVDNEATNAVLGVGRNGSGGSPFQGSIGTQSRGQWLIALNGSTFGYVYNIAPTPLGGYIDVIGYGFNR